jgi:hypothetical protein
MLALRGSDLDVDEHAAEYLKHMSQMAPRGLGNGATVAQEIHPVKEGGEGPEGDRELYTMTSSLLRPVLKSSAP